MEGKQLDFNAPLLSVRRFASGAPPAPPTSSSSANVAAAAAKSRGEGHSGGGAGGERSRRASFPFYKSELKSGPVRNPGVVPFVWEQSPGRPKDGSEAGGPPVVAPRPPPGRVPKRLPGEREERIGADASNSASGGALPRRSPTISSSTSTHTAAAAPTTATTNTTSSSTANGTLSKPSDSSRDEPKAKVGTKLMVEEEVVEEEEDEEEDAFSDALDTLSRSESFFMNCSISGMSAGVEAREPSGRFSTDPQVRDFMMGRFLPAAQAMATGPPQGGPRKAVAVPSRGPPRRVIGNGGELRRPAVPLPPQQRPNLVTSYPRTTHQLDVGNGDGSEDDDDDYDDTGRLPMKGCGLLPRFCLKSSFCLLNPVPGMKVRGRTPLPAGRRLNPHLRTSHHGSAIDADDEHSWEEVYKHKLRREHQPVGEEGSKLTSESNHLSYWSDSQTADGSSPYRRSTTGGVSPYRNDLPLSPFHEGKGFLGVPKCENRMGEDSAAFESCAKDEGEYWEISPHLNSKQASGSLSPVAEKTVYVDSVRVLENSDSKLSSLDTKDMISCTDRDSKIGGESQRIETSPILGVCMDNALRYKDSEVVEAEERFSADQSGCVEQMDNMMGSGQNHVLDDPQHLKSDDQGKNGYSALQSLLPPPLPKSPSESWLWRTLPYVSSRNPTPQSFLKFHPKKQVTHASSTDPKWEVMVKTSVLSKGPVRFADELARPANVD